ncbi:MAG TPA: GGDEF domain-containing protein, partial [Spirochaetales bacterium]|nr:GGDEF domain-containing protein [Spirochaetales bacterium]
KLYNRLYVIEAGQNVVLYHRRYGLELHLALLDIDHFKKVNDTLGHPVGDSVLREFSTIIQGCVRTSDTAARYGGEEFLILLPRTNADDALMVAERIRATVEGHDFRGVPWRLTASLGVATLASTDTMESLVARSDELLYRSKNAGRNRVSMA